LVYLILVIFYAVESHLEMIVLYFKRMCNSKKLCKWLQLHTLESFFDLCSSKVFLILPLAMLIPTMKTRSYYITELNFYYHLFRYQRCHFRIPISRENKSGKNEKHSVCRLHKITKTWVLISVNNLIEYSSEDVTLNILWFLKFD